MNRRKELRIIFFTEQDIPQHLSKTFQDLAGTTIASPKTQEMAYIFVHHTASKKVLSHEMMHSFFQTNNFQLFLPSFLVEAPIYLLNDEVGHYHTQIENTLLKNSAGIFSKSLNLMDGRGFFLKKDIAAHIFEDLNIIDPNFLSALFKEAPFIQVTPHNIEEYLLSFVQESKLSEAEKYLKQYNFFDATYAQELYCVPQNAQDMDILCTTGQNDLPTQIQYSTIDLHKKKTTYTGKFTGNDTIHTHLQKKEVAQLCITTNNRETCFPTQ